LRVRRFWDVIFKMEAVVPVDVSSVNKAITLMSLISVDCVVAL